MNPRAEAAIKAAAARVLRVRANALRAEVYGVLEEARVGRGRTYRVRNPRTGRKVEHTASAPGDPPARLWGTLMESVKVVHFDAEALVAHVGPDPAVFRNKGEPYYPTGLELGTVRIRPRPFMRPALERFRRAVEKGGRPSDAP